MRGSAKRLNYANVLRVAYFRAQPDIEPSPLDYQAYRNRLRYIEWKTKLAMLYATGGVPHGR